MNDMSLALQITGVGMGLVFAALLVLWLTMILLAALTADASTTLSEKSAADSAQPDSVAKQQILAQAAAVGVALAIAEQQVSSAHPLATPPTSIVSAWQLGMRTRQMTQKGGRFK